MDRAELLVRESTFSTAVMVKADWSDLELVPLSATRPVSAETARDLAERGFIYLGVIGLHPCGQFATVLEPIDLDLQRRGAVVAAFSAYCAHLLEGARQRQNFVNFAERLWALEDNRD